MFRLIIVGLLFVSSLSALPQRVPLGSFKNYDALIQSLAKLNNAKYQNKIDIEEKDGIYYVYLTQEGYVEAQIALEACKKVLESAIIEETAVALPEKQKHQESTVLTQTNRENSQKIPWQSVGTRQPNPSNEAREKVSSKQNNLSFSDELKRKVFYLCYEGKKKGAIKPVVKAVFNQNFITYSSEMMEIPPIVTPYKLIKNDLHITVGMFSVGSTRSRLESVTDTYLRTTNWADGKQVQSLRFYFNKADAVAFARRN